MLSCISPTAHVEQLLPPPEAAKVINMSPRWLWGNTAPRGACIPSVRCGSRVKYAVSDLEAWIAANRSGGEVQA